MAVPIHYDTMYKAPTYTQVDDPAGAFVAAADELGVATRVLAPGQTIELDRSRSAPARRTWFNRRGVAKNRPAFVVHRDEA